MPMEWEPLRERLQGVQGRRYWRSLEELADTPAFREYVEREFPEQASEWTDPVTRRRFLTLMGAAFGLAGLSGCSTQPAPPEKIMPYVRAPEQLVPGQPLYFATAHALGGVASGLLVQSREGRPIKIEGNPDHPASPPAFRHYRHGPTDRFAQASILGLYDPDRSQAITYLGRPRGWSEFLAAFRTALTALPTGGAGLYVLTETLTSPTLAAQLDLLQKRFPEARWHQYEPVNRDNVYAGTRQAFGRPVAPQYQLQDADVLLALDADFLGCGPGHLRHTRDFTARRRVWSEAGPTQARMNRLYVVECTPSVTGAAADHRLALRASEIAPFARAVAAALGVPGAPPPGPGGTAHERWVAAVARDLEQHRGRCVVLAGDHQPPAVQALVHAMNERLGNQGQTVRYIEPIEARLVDQATSLRELVEAMDGGKVRVLLILGGNPVYNTPADLRFAERLAQVPLRVHLGLYQDETAVLCHWHVPEDHYLESWGDVRGPDGTVTIQQPLIVPLYASTRSAHDLLAALTEQPERASYEIVRDYWRQNWPKEAGEFERGWQRALHDGFVRGTARSAQQVQLREGWAGTPAPAAAPRDGGLEIVFQPDPTLHDGRFANNAWLQELPKPLTKLTWDNAAILSPATARELGLAAPVEGAHGGPHGEAVVPVVDLRYAGASVRAPVWVQPGHADGAVTVHLGHGRSRAGRVGTGTGFNAYALRTAAAPWFGTGLEVVPLRGEQATLACTQLHQTMAGRDLVRAGTLAEYQHDPTLGHAAAHGHPAAPPPGEHEHGDRRLVPLNMYPPYPYDGYKWGMVIDLSACIGCKACVVACQAENNIPVVGKEEVVRGHEMHWLRIDTYHKGDPVKPDSLSSYFQPVPCMHCETAPCEVVCPVAATAHSHDGLNDMIYNRCVGTRYCSNNCPYKVRRFNFLQYADYATESLKLQRNPEVTVRTRGVMEKCTYCVQRIRSAEIEAKKAERTDADRPGVAPIRDGELLTACQAACPAGAIVFGDLNDRGALVTHLRAQPHQYGLLAELNTLPRTTYLAAVRNPNPEL